MAKSAWDTFLELRKPSGPSSNLSLVKRIRGSRERVCASEHLFGPDHSDIGKYLQEGVEADSS